MIAVVLLQDQRRGRSGCLLCALAAMLLCGRKNADDHDDHSENYGVLFHSLCPFSAKRDPFRRNASEAGVYSSDSSCNAVSTSSSTSHFFSTEIATPAPNPARNSARKILAASRLFSGFLMRLRFRNARASAGSSTAA